MCTPRGFTNEASCFVNSIAKNPDNKAGRLFCFVFGPRKHWVLQSRRSGLFCSKILRTCKHRPQVTCLNVISVNKYSSASSTVCLQLLPTYKASRELLLYISKHAMTLNKYWFFGSVRSKNKVVDEL